MARQDKSIGGTGAIQQDNFRLLASAAVWATLQSLRLLTSCSRGRRLGPAGRTRACQMSGDWVMDGAPDQRPRFGNNATWSNQVGREAGNRLALFALLGFNAAPRNSCVCCCCRRILRAGPKLPQGIDTSGKYTHNQMFRSEGFPSGQRDQTVNLTALPSKVRILPPPPITIEFASK